MSEVPLYPLEELSDTPSLQTGNDPCETALVISLPCVVRSVASGKRPSCPVSCPPLLLLLDSIAHCEEILLQVSKSPYGGKCSDA